MLDILTRQLFCRDDAKRVFFAVLVLVGFITSGCTRPPKEFILDSAGHRVTNGFRLLELGRIDDARREFRTALTLDPRCCDAYRGIGLSLGMQERFDQAFRAMGHARACAKTDKAKALADVGFLRLVTLKKGRDWVDRAEALFLKALDEDHNSSEAYYYMGVAYREARMLPKAVWAFRKAVKLGGPFRERAEDALALVNKVIAAKPETQLGRAMAFKAALTRGEVAALIARELGCTRILGMHSAESICPAEPKARLPVPQDIRRYPYRAEIARILSVGIQGLTLFPDGSFRPDMPVTRSDFATILADIIRKLKLAPSKSKEIQSLVNPFDDLERDAPYFADVILCTRLTHMLDPDHGAFGPMELVSGADVLLAVRRLRDASGYE